MKKINKTTLGVFALIALISLLLGFLLGGHSSNTGHEGHGHESADTPSVEEQTWTCSMHPQIRLDKPGQCPICGMTLIPLEKGNSNSQVDGPNVQLSPYARKLAQVQTTRVTQGGVDGRKEFTGTIAWDETRLKTEPAWFSGRIEKLKVSYTGQYVKEGQVIAEIYSPELYGAAEEWRQAKQSGDEQLIQAVKKKLELLGLDSAGIQNLAGVDSEKVVQRAKHSGVVVHRNVEEGQYVQIGTPLVKLGSNSNLWVELEVYEQDLPLIQRGLKISMESESLPGKKFSAKVQFIDPVVNQKTRTTRVRLSITNRKNMLKPGMFVRGNMEIPQKGNQLYIPETAPLLTGKRALVYVEETEGVYTNRTVELGELRNGFYEVLSGLTGSEVIVKRGAFKLDAAMQIQAYPSMMYPEGGAPSGAHNHGGLTNDKSLMKKDQSKNHDGHQNMKQDIKKKTTATSKLSNADNQWMQKTYKSYLELQASLAQDNAKNAAKSLKSFAMNLHTIPKTLDDGHSHHRAKSFDAAAQKGDLESLRTEMLSVSEIMIQWITKSKFQPKEGAAVYFCPMSNNNKGAQWLQTGGQVKNPFYGSAMSTCGEQRKVLSPGEK